MKTLTLIICAALITAVSCSDGGKKKRNRAQTPCSFHNAIPMQPHPPLLSAADAAQRHALQLLRDFYGPLADSSLRIPNDGHANRCGHRVHARMVLGFLNSDWDFPLEEPCGNRD